MGPILRDLDRLLRGDFTRPEQLRAGRIDVPWLRLVLGGLLCGTLYGACMGIWAASHNLADEAELIWVLAGALKVPLLFLLTLLVTFPSLYVFSALANGRLHLGDTLRLLLGAIGVNLALLAGFAPITVFFTVFTESYAFMVALNVAFFGLSGLIGLAFLARAVRSVFAGAPQPDDAHGDDTDSDDALDDALDDGARSATRALAAAGPSGTRAPRAESGARARHVFRVWLLIFGVVGAQMGWVLRPFIGNPTLEFAWSRDPQAHVFRGLLDMLRDLLGA